MLTLERRVRRKREGGFTLIEVLIAMLLLLIGVAGVLSLQLVSAKATAYSRHATEATIAAEDLMEELSSSTTANLIAAGGGGDTVTAPGGPYNRTWTIAASTEPEVFQVNIDVQWQERGVGTFRSIKMATQRRIQ